MATKRQKSKRPAQATQPEYVIWRARELSLRIEIHESSKGERFVSVHFPDAWGSGKGETVLEALADFDANILPCIGVRDWDGV